MSLALKQTSKYKNLTASGAVKSAPGFVTGVIINSHSSGTLKLWDNTAGSGAVVCDTITFSSGERTIPLFDIDFKIGLYATIGGTANITIAYN